MRADPDSQLIIDLDICGPLHYVEHCKSSSLHSRPGRGSSDSPSYRRLHSHSPSRPRRIHSRLRRPYACRPCLRLALRPAVLRLLHEPNAPIVPPTRRGGCCVGRHTIIHWTGVSWGPDPLLSLLSRYVLLVWGTSESGC